MKHQAGRLEVISGGMFSGKTEELIRRVRRATIAKQQVQVFKPEIDRRYRAEAVNSHSGVVFNAIPIGCPQDVLEKLDPETTVVAIDEAQFLHPTVIPVLMELVARGIRVIVAGLNTDFRGEAFGPMPIIMALADEVTSLHAICMVCGEEATQTQRIVNGKPAHYEEQIILVGAAEAYEARCRVHHEVPGKP